MFKTSQAELGIISQDFTSIDNFLALTTGTLIGFLPPWLHRHLMHVRDHVLIMSVLHILACQRVWHMVGIQQMNEVSIECQVCDIT